MKFLILSVRHFNFKCLVIRGNPFVLPAFLGERLFHWGISAIAAAFKNKKNAVKAIFVFMVGMTGFEPATPCTPCKCATRLRYIPTTKKFIKLSERKCKFFFSKMKNKFSINYGNVKNPGMRMQTGIQLKKAKF